MFPTATIVFREFLEIALILGIVIAATRGVPNKTAMIILGLVLGVLGSVVIAFFTDSISNAIDGMGQEIFNAAIMFIAVIFLSWTVIWMKKHSKEMSKHLNEVGQDIVKGNKSLYVLAIVIALATFREGAEIVLFTYGMIASNAFPITDIIIGGIIGAAGGTIIGFMLYFGLLKTVKRHLFTVTSWMLIILTAGISAQGANFLIAAGILPELIYQVWDSSHIISGNGFFGETLGILIGYTPRPTGMELIFYISTLVVVGTAYKLAGRKPQNKFKNYSYDSKIDSKI